MGYVTFVGAGPYDAKYMTLAARNALEEADCVLYDHLLDPYILSFTKGTCIYVGKQGHQASVTQEEINALLIEKAKQYNHVVRLKGGDSFVFGRGGEEGIALHEAGISFHFIPGITSAIAVAESVGIPVTHRGVATGFLVLSAHLQNHALEIPLKQVQNENITLLFLMGNSRILQIVELLLKAGRDIHTPMAIISHGCSYKEQVCITTLEKAAEAIKKKPPTTPTMIVVGDVVHLHKSLQPKKSPLAHMHVLVYKINNKKSNLTSLLEKQGAHVVECQSGDIQYKTCSTDSFLAYQGYIFTSKYAIHAFFHNLRKETIDIRKLMNKHFYVIGKKCYEVLSQYGIYADVVANGRQEDLLQRISKENKSDILYVCGDQSKTLSSYASLVLYENKAVTQAAICDDFNAIFFTCASSVNRCCLSLCDQLCIAIGETTKQALEDKGCKKIRQARETTYEAMVDVLLEEVKECIVEED